jgi:hypothetical protein
MTLAMNGHRSCPLVIEGHCYIQGTSKYDLASCQVEGRSMLLPNVTDSVCCCFEESCFLCKEMLRPFNAPASQSRMDDGH